MNTQLLRFSVLSEHTRLFCPSSVPKGMVSGKRVAPSG